VIAEAWDAAGLYQIGHFPGDRWARGGMMAYGMTSGLSSRAKRESWALWPRAAQAVADLYEDDGELPCQ